jgi:hypothetical protein
MTSDIDIAETADTPLEELIETLAMTQEGTTAS